METNLGLSGLFKIPNSESLSCLWLPHPQRVHLGHGWRQSPESLPSYWGDRDVEKFGESGRATTSVEQEMEIKGFVYRLDPKPDYVLMNFLFIQEGNEMEGCDSVFTEHRHHHHCPCLLSSFLKTFVKTVGTVSERNILNRSTEQKGKPDFPSEELRPR